MARRVISRLGGFGGPRPHCGRFDLGRATYEDKERTGSNQKTIRWCLQPRARLSVSGLVKTILKHLQLLQGNEATIHHSVKNGQKLIDPLFRVHDFND